MLFNPADAQRVRGADAGVVGNIVASRRGMTAGLALAIAGLATMLGCAGCAAPVPSHADVVKVDLSGRTLGVLPDRYLGLSFESSSTEGVGAFADNGNLPRLLENLGPGVLRFGGNSVDQSYAGPDPATLSALAGLVRRTQWDVIFSVDLGHFTADQAGRDARAAEQAFGGRLTAIACGNEPDDFGGNGIRPASFSEAGYLTEARACIDAVREAVPDVRIAGPDTGHLRWLNQYASVFKGTVSLLDQHYYPLSDCGSAGTADELLSRATAAAEGRRIRMAAAAARTAGVPLRISETNSASCGGIPGVSDTFASALWAIDYSLIGAEQGASGMNFHDSMTLYCNAYSALCRTETSQYAVRPIYYGLLFTHLLGTGRLLPVTVPSGSGLAAHAVKSASGRIRVVIENLTGQAKNTALHAGTISGNAAVLHLTAPSPRATGQIRIQGAMIRHSGTLTPGSPDDIACNSGVCDLRLTPYSAAIVTLPGA